MPRRRNGEMPLPEGWDFAHDYDGKMYFIDHNTKETTWIDPRDSYTKPQTFADCIGTELPHGWEEGYDPQVGVYYIDHINQCTQLEDPRLEWRAIQEAMLSDYLHVAQDVLQSKREIFNIKQQRLCLAEDEYNNLNVLFDPNTPRSSLYSSTSSISTKYDPDLLKSDVTLAKNRVSRLKRELEQIKVEMSLTQKGVDTLVCVEQKMTGPQAGYYSVTQARAMMTELREIQRSLTSGEQEKDQLMRSLSKLKDDLSRLQLGESSRNESTLSLSNTDKLSTASQTDLSDELLPIGNRLAVMARLRLEYDEARKHIQTIQLRLANLEDKVMPGQAESDKDRLLVFQEKEQLLRELRSMTSHTRSYREMTDIQSEIEKLQQDLNNALEFSNQTIANRLRLHEEKQILLCRLRNTLKTMTCLESQLRTLSASSLSVSSSSSLRSLSNSSSKGSLSSALSFTDIYGGPQCYQNVHDKPIDMAELHRQFEQVLGGDSNPLPPAYELSCLEARPSRTPPLSPLTESPQKHCVSAAVSNESVAGDSGVFEASQRTFDDSSDTAQIQIKLRFSVSDSTLHIGIQRIKNLSVLSIPDRAQVFIKVALLPSDSDSLAYSMLPVTDIVRETFSESFPIRVQLNKLCAKTLQININCSVADGQPECLGSVQVSLADFNPKLTLLKWCNILSSKVLENECPSIESESHTGHKQQREESSDESTIISSKTSTLTRNEGCAEPSQTVSFHLEDLDSEEEQAEEEQEEDEQDDQQQLEILQEFEYCSEELCQVPETPEEDVIAGIDKETDTVCLFKPDKRDCLSKAGKSSCQGIFIKRSQTFSPSATSQYICRLNRSGSDSSMPLYHRSQSSFLRGAVERRSLRWRSGAGSAVEHLPTFKHPTTTHSARTSLDLELDLRAQHNRLNVLENDLERLRELKNRLQSAKDKGDTEVATWVVEDVDFQNLISHTQPKSNDNKKVEKLLKKTSKEIYKLRKNKVGKGKPDLISFKEKMAFFTRSSLVVPLVPTESSQVLLDNPSGSELKVDRTLGVEV